VGARPSRRNLHVATPPSSRSRLFRSSMAPSRKARRFVACRPQRELTTAPVVFIIAFIPHPRHARQPTLTTSPLTTHQPGQPRSGTPPEAIGGAGRPDSRPMATDQDPVGARTTPCSAASDPLGGLTPADDPLIEAENLSEQAGPPQRPCRRTAIPSPGRADYNRTPPRNHSPYAYIMNRDSLSPCTESVLRRLMTPNRRVQ
jgi:hypothetical protein